MDLNADLGELPGSEGAAIDEALLATVTSANVACGGHAGDDASMLRVCALAVRHGVAVGAQVSYVDRAGFGRRRLDVAAPVLVAQLVEQIEALSAAARLAGTDVSYVKPHGALYHAAATDDSVASAVLAAMHRTVGPVPVLMLPGSRLAHAAAAQGIPVVEEAFADRAYHADGSLVSRDHPGAVLNDRDHVIARVVGLATTGTLVALDGTRVRVTARSVCVHGDTPGAVTLAAAVRQALVDHGVAVTSFVPQPGSGRAVGGAPSRVVRRMGDRALLARCTADEVTALLDAVDAAVADGRLTGIDDVVPAARSLLLRLGPGADVARVSTALAALPLARTTQRESATVEIEVHYDGADLDDVARRTGLSPAEVVAIHAGTTYAVAFCGFTPGFAYLTGLDPRLHVPRLDAPRTRVPAGSVAVAAEYAAVYPRSSPGGWRLLGRTRQALFDPDRTPPALLSPGGRVRFVPVGRVR